MTNKNKATPQNRKRKFSDSALELPKTKKTAFMTPQPALAQGAKTPKKANQTPKGLVGKQQKAAGKTPVSQKNGKVQKPQKKKVNVASDDDEDDDDDDDDNVEVGSEDEDDDEDNEEFEDEDDEDDGEEDEEDEDDNIQPPPGKKAKIPNPTNTKDKTPKDGSKKNKPQPQAAAAHKEAKTTPASNIQKGKEPPSDDKARIDSRDAKTLFIKNLPNHSTTKQIKALSKDIKQVRLRNKFTMIDGKRTTISFAYVEFATETAAEQNFKRLAEASLRGKKLEVDYVGSKSSFQREKLKTEPANEDPLKLYVSGLPMSVTVDDLRKLFPEAAEIILPRRKKNNEILGYGFIQFPSKELTDKYHEKGQNFTLKGSKLVVLHARKRKERPVKDNKASQQKQKEGKGKDGKQGKKDGSKSAVKQSKANNDDDNDEDDDEETEENVAEDMGDEDVDEEDEDVDDDDSEDDEEEDESDE